MTYAEKLLQWRSELGQMARELLDSDDPEQAQKVVHAITVIKAVHSDLARLGLDECEWLSEGKDGRHEG